MISRRAFLRSSAVAFAWPAMAQEQPDVPLAQLRLSDPVPFTPDTPLEMARDLAARPYAPRATVPQAWLDLVYDEYRQFNFDTGRALWRDSDRPLEVDFFLPGLYFPRGVEIDTVRGGAAQHVLFDLDVFNQTDRAPDLPIDDTLDYSGLRLRADLYDTGALTEFMVFQGASYFRAIGRNQAYGLSARGLALNTADEAGEEFPEFTHFWIEEPQVGDETYIIHALLDGPSAAGAYRFEIDHTDENTNVAVTATLIPRSDLGHAGLAPLTSMFLFDETNRHRFNDFRPAVHDSEGLLIHNGNGEHIWRPLANPVALQISAFGDTNPKGFGLMQRNRRFDDYADLEALYHTRPSLWIEPGEDWGAGAVTLVEIPADKEIYDNIVAYWRPAGPMVAGQEHSISYQMTWGTGPAADRTLARVINTRQGERVFATGILTTVDFEAIPAMEGRMEDFTIVITAGPAMVSDGLVQQNPETGGPRLAFTFDPGDHRTIELRAQMYLDGVPCTEVFLYRWTV